MSGWVLPKGFKLPKCRVCGDPDPEGFMLKDRVWKRVLDAYGFKRARWICFGCVSAQVNVKINDFTSARMNNLIRLGYWLRVTEER